MEKEETHLNKSIQEMEEDVLNFWKEHRIFEKSIEQRPEDNLYVFYDGPPFISGLPHYGHLLGSIAKDLIPRYWTMQGKRVERVWGWDAHGLPVESKVQKKLGIKNRREIEDFGLEKFTEECYAYTSETSEAWKWYIDRIGRWVDLDNAYKTIDQSYMESVIWAFKQLYDKGLIYSGYRTSLYCPVCGTPVSDFEIAMDNSYKDVEDPAVTMKFRITSEGVLNGAYILAWTTTPWTLPSNRALVVDPDSTYVLVCFENANYIVAEPRLQYVFANKTFEIVDSLKGESLVGLAYEPLYRIYKENEKDYKVYSYEGMVHMEEGTGIVHSAPGFGDIDTEMGLHYGLSLTNAMDDEGKFVSGDSSNPFEGLYFKKADPKIIEDLTQKKLLFNVTTISHRYPYHDRCDTLLMHRAQKSWFVDVQKLKPEMLRANEDINWVPAHLKEGQFKQVIENAPDWCISRKRFWATPMPVWQSDDGDIIVPGSIAEIEQLSGQKVENLHRPYIDEIVIEQDGKEYRRIPEVLDCWFESGSMPYGQFHYPFENKKKFEDNFPGDYISEYVAQVRAWFNVLHRLSVAIFGSGCFKNVIVSGVVQGTDGRKMSKTFQNYPDPRDILERLGGDAVRLFFMNNPLMLSVNTNVDEEGMKTKLKNVLNPYWNSTKFLLTYAEANNWEPSKDLVLGERPKSYNVLDMWIMARLDETIQTFVKNIEAYTIPPAINALEQFVDDLSRWYVRRSRDRISAGDKDALSTLYYVLTTYTKAAAPVIPFLTETVFQNLVVPFSEEAPESVHLCPYPEVDREYIPDSELLDAMEKTRSVVSEALAHRPYPIRQPLGLLKVIVKDDTFMFYPELIKDELNVDDVLVETQSTEDVTFAVEWDTELTDDLKLRGQLREFTRKVQGLRKKLGLSVGDEITVVYESTEDMQQLVETYAAEIKEKIQATDLIPGDELSITKK